MMFHVAIALLQCLFVGFFLVIAALILLQAERRVKAYVEHRVGPAHVGPGGSLQLLADLLKMTWRGRRNLAVGELPFWSALLALPFVFVGVLFFDAPRMLIRGREMLVLLLLILMSAILEGAVSIGRAKGLERFSFARHIPSQALGMITMLMCVAVVFLHTGSTSLADVNAAQSQAPFLFLAKGPGLFLAAIIFFFSILMVEEQRPFSSGEDRSVSGTKNFLFQFLARLWVVALFAFWTVVFAGGLEGPISWITLIPRIAGVSLVFIWLSKVLPEIRAGDAQELQMRVFLPGSLVAFLLEAGWIVLFSGAR